MKSFVCLSLITGSLALLAGPSFAQTVINDMRSPLHLQFRDPNSREQVDLLKLAPPIRDLQPPTEIYKVSNSISLEISAPGQPEKIMKVTARVLRYTMDHVSQTEDDEHSDINLIVLQDQNGRVIYKAPVINSLNFRIFVVPDKGGGKDIVIRSVEEGPTDDTLHSHVRQVNAEIDRADSIALGAINLNTWHFLIADAENTVVLGQPKGKKGDWGLYKVSSKGLELVRALPATIPGKDSQKEEPLPIAREVVGGLQVDDQSFAIVNTLSGLASIEVHTGRMKSIFDIRKEDQFAAVLKNMKPQTKGSCLRVNLAIYPNEHGSVFYSGIMISNVGGLTYPGNGKIKPVTELELAVSSSARGPSVREGSCP